MKSNQTYTHQYFGSGYTLTKIYDDSWCELEKAYTDGSISLVGDYFKNLTPDKLEDIDE